MNTLPGFIEYRLGALAGAAESVAVTRPAGPPGSAEEAAGSEAVSGASGPVAIRAE